MSNDLKNKKILVIGGAGFIGSFVVKELLKHDVLKLLFMITLSRGKMAIFKVIKR